ncbi:MAG: hypothetical protein FJW31_21510 [Acidobacteria bacterium]|nr:hypothetical protein [Acidobacteriota bacterium]
MVWAGTLLVALGGVLVTGVLRMALAGGTDVLSPLAVGTVVLPVALLLGYVGLRLRGVRPLQPLLVKPLQRAIPKKKAPPILDFTRSSRLA